MLNRAELLSLCLLLSICAAGTAVAQVLPKSSITEATPAQTEEPAQAEPPKTVVSVEFTDNLLTVDFSNTDFGTAIKAVAEKAGFIVEGSGDVFSRKLNTRFSNVDIDRGVTRLLTLVKESNYTLNYDTTGAISKLEIFGTIAASTPSAGAKQPVPSISARRPVASSAAQPAQRPAVSPDPRPSQRPAITTTPTPRRIRPTAQPRIGGRQIAPARPATQTGSAADPETAVEINEEAGAEKNEEPVEEVPYVAPQPPSPAFVPKR